MNTSEYNHCVDAYSDGLYRFLLKNVNDREQAKDLVQEAFMRLWQKRKKVEAAKSKSYLFTTAYHAMIDHFRKNNRTESYDVSRHGEDEVDTQYSDLAEVLNRAVAQLPTDQRAVVMLRDYEGYSYKEIGEITGLNESQVKVYIFRARLFLKNYLVKMEYVI